MTAIAAVISDNPNAATEHVARHMLGAMASRGSEQVEIWRDASAIIGVARDRWQCSADFGGDVLVAADGDIVVAADATLYYRDDLRRRLNAAGACTVDSRSASTLLLQAYRVWGDRFLSHIEGDFAFLLWNRRDARVLAARDFVGTRPLHYAVVDGTLIVASSTDGVLAHPMVPRDLNWAAVGDLVARYFAAAHETCYRSVLSLNPGHTASATVGGSVHVARHWSPPPIATGEGPPFEAAAEELRELLIAAVRERSAQTSTTAVWLSGGYDSPSLFATARAALAPEGRSDDVVGVSMSYPPGDMGREDDLIQAVLQHCGGHTHWVDSQSIPLFVEREDERAAARVDGFIHPFELWQKAMLSATRAEGARVVLQGIGGDELFGGTNVYLADLLRRGQWLAVAREWRLRMHRFGWRYFVQQAVLPAFPFLRTTLGALRGRPIRDPFAYQPPAWLNPEFRRLQRLDEREKEFTPRVPGLGMAAALCYSTLTHPAFGVVREPLAQFALEAGVELRIPLYDERIVRFVAPRPYEERLTGMESKRLLRAAMRGLLPETILAPRRNRTGMTGGYFDRWMRRDRPEWIPDVLASPVLADAGVIDAGQLRSHWEQYLRTGENGLGTMLYATIETELWLRARLAGVHSTQQTVACAPVGGVDVSASRGAT